MSYVMVVQELTAMCSKASVHSQNQFGSVLESSLAFARSN